MQLRVLETLAELEEICVEWNNVLINSATHVPFLRHEYMVSWWKTLGGGEWDHGDLYVISYRSEEGTLQAIAPFFHSKNLERKNALMLIGSMEISDYLDLICPKEYLVEFIDAILDHLSNPDIPNWDVLDLYNLPEESPTLSALSEAVRKRGWRFHQERIHPAPLLKLPNQWEDYLGGIQKKQRHEIRRKLRRAENHFLPVRWYIVNDEANFDAEIEDFLNLMAIDPQKKAFLTDPMRTQMRTASYAAFKAGWLQLSFLEIGSEKAAGYLNFDSLNRLWIYNSGIDFRFNSFSPGWVLLARLIQWGIENGRESLDFMRGNEDYKYRFGGVDRFVVRVQIWREK